MAQSTLTKKIKILERDISEIKRYLGLGVSKERVNFKIDFKNWQRVKRTAKKIRKELFKEKYPRLYAKLKKRK